MNFLPVVHHELRLALRRKLSNHRVRMFCTTAPMAIALWLLLVWSAWTPTASFGRQFLQAISSFGYIGSLLAGILLAADSLSQEKREGTLPLLFLTCLRTHDILLGKLVSKMIVAFYALLALVPILTLSVTLRNIGVGHCTRLFMVWLNALFVSLSINLLVSSLSREQRTAHVGAVAGLVVLVVVFPLLGTGVSMGTGSRIWRFLFLAVSPSGVFAFANLYQTQSAAGWFWSALLLNQTVAWTALGIAYQRLLQVRSHPWADDENTPRATAGLSAAALQYRQHLRQMLLEGRPIEWLACRSAGSLFSRWIWPVIALGVVLCSPVDGLGNSRGQVAFLLFVVAQTAFKLTVATHASYAFARDRRSGALESLLGTAVDVPEIASGLFRGFIKRFGQPLLFATVLGLAAAGQLLWNGSKDSALLLTATAVMLVVDIYCLFWVGLLEGLASRNPGIGLAKTVLQILIFPAAWFGAAYQLFWRSSVPELVILWFVLAVVNHLLFMISARARLKRYFRTLALKPFGEKPPPMESDWSPINWEAEGSRLKG